MIRKASALNKKVFVVIVTYNGARWIDKNITSLLNSSYPVGIIAIDNNSTDNSVALLEGYPQVNLIKSPENLGFGKANNIGMRKALDKGADYIFLLNQDAWVFNDTIHRLVEVMEGDQKIGVLSPAHYLADETTLDGNFKTYLNRSVPLNTDGLFVTKFVNAAAWMLSRECVQKVGVFEPLFSHYGEDRNYCDRVLYHGFSIIIDTNSRVVHDRVISRNFKKDIIQSKYKILGSLLNINHSVVNSYLNGLREVFGLPKYFMKFYSTDKSIKMFFSLLGYYLGLIIGAYKIRAARNNAK